MVMRSEKSDWKQTAREVYSYESEAVNSHSRSIGFGYPRRIPPDEEVTRLDVPKVLVLPVPVTEQSHPRSMLSG